MAFSYVRMHIFDDFKVNFRQLAVRRLANSDLKSICVNFLPYVEYDTPKFKVSLRQLARVL